MCGSGPRSPGAYRDSVTSISGCASLMMTRRCAESATTSPCPGAWMNGSRLGMMADRSNRTRSPGAYVELHAHSAYSFLDGASLPEELAVRAAELGYDALALTDHDGLYGSLEFAHAAKAFGVRPITGAEVTLEGGAHVTLLVETAAGYANLCRLLTAAHAQTRPKEGAEPLPPALDPALFDELHEGLVCLSGC